jgi:hypothetical protein
MVLSILRIPEDSVAILSEWFDKNRIVPYPCTTTKKELALKTNLSIDQIKWWFTRYRRKILNQKDNYKYNLLSKQNKTILESSYSSNPHPNNNEIQTITEMTGLSEKK